MRVKQPKLKRVRSPKMKLTKSQKLERLLKTIKPRLA